MDVTTFNRKTDIQCAEGTGTVVILHDGISLYIALINGKYFAFLYIAPIKEYIMIANTK